MVGLCLYLCQSCSSAILNCCGGLVIEANVKASPWDNGSKELCPRTQRSGHGLIRTEDRLIRSLTP